MSFSEFQGSVETGGMGAADVGAVEFSCGSTSPRSTQSVQLGGEGARASARIRKDRVRLEVR